jgi:hypothetical protein
MRFDALAVSLEGARTPGASAKRSTEGDLEARHVADALHLVDRVLAMLWRLTR